MWKYEWFNWLAGRKKEIVLLSLLITALMAAQWMNLREVNASLILEDGRIIALQRQSREDSLTLPMVVHAERDGKKESFKVTISLKGVSPSDKQESTKTAPLQEEQLAYVIEELVNAIGSEEGLKVSLPDQLEDGTTIRWSRQKDFNFLFTLLLFPACLLYLYRSEGQKEKASKKKEAEDIRRALPSFNDQILLLLNCGMIFHDAFYRITANYEQRQDKHPLGILLIRIKKESEESGRTIVTVMKEFSHEITMREYARMVNIFVDHEHRGVALADKLQGESQLLWEGRKALALQKGKEVETKMTFPLAALLIVLILVAGVPAMMNM